jgi:restriction system protein
MPIPDFQTIMLPLFQLAGDGKVHSIHEAVEKLADQFGLTEEEQTILLSSGQQPIFYNRVGWAIIYMKQDKLLEDLRISPDNIRGGVAKGHRRLH